jgi:hypothetical protein
LLAIIEFYENFLCRYFFFCINERLEQNRIITATQTENKLFIFFSK